MPQIKRIKMIFELRPALAGCNNNDAPKWL